MSVLDRLWPTRLASHTALRDRVVARYASPERGYHDIRHLREVLENVETLLSRPEMGPVDREGVVLAAWFHDAVHDGRPDDEERSAVLAESTLTSSGVPAPLVAEVARLVRLTRDHRPEPEDRAGQVLSDADLAILASDRPRYDEYVRGVRREYAHLDDAAFRDGRAQVLRALLAKTTLFHTPLGRQLWEEAARANVQRELAALTPESSPG